jgi:hypothetical protein
MKEIKKNYKIIDNFLPEENFKNLQNLLMCEELTWFWKEHMTSDDSYFFNHCFYNNYIPQSGFFNEFIVPILIKLKCKAPIEVRANLMLKKNISYQCNFHTDRPFNCKTAIFYINKNNGYTILDNKKKIKIECVENRMVVFNSQIYHAAFSQTDTERRIIINFNYF